ncbi:MAG: ABC transporter substrate-binding protein [Spirochaetales bacterium]|nr:ABC transporter substrate-binding protein [Spirochaetales bacterium]
MKRSTATVAAARLPWFLAVAVMAMAGASCAPRAPLVLGFATSLSGPNYMLGVEGRNAAELFVKEANASGGIAGRQLMLLVRDFGSDDRNVVPVTRELVDAGAVVILGYFTSTSAVTALSLRADERVPLVSPSATSSELSGLDDGFYRTIMSSEYDVPYLVAHMKERKRERVLFLATATNRSYVETYAAPLRTLVNVVLDERFDSIDDIDFAAIEDVRERIGYDAILVVASSIDTGTLAQELTIRGLDAPLYVSGWAGNDELLVYGGSSVDGAVFVHQTDIDHPGVVALAGRYQSVFKQKPGFSAIQTWDALSYIASAITLAEGDESRFAKAIGGIRSFDGLAGRIEIDEYGDATRTVYYKRVSGSSIVVDGVAE